MRVPKLEMHLAHKCNLRCENCSHYSNYGFQGIVPFCQGGGWLRAWAERIYPLRFSFLGGEPLLNRETPDYLRLARQCWPTTELRLVTNGLLLRRWGGPLWTALSESNVLLTFSIHSRLPGYQKKMTAVLKYVGETADRYGVRWEARDSISGWYRLYKGEGPNMLPFDDNDPAASWSVCQNKHCVTLQDNALWKCPPAAHLPRVAAKFLLGDKDAWAVPLSYEPLTIDASDDEIRSFFAEREEPICGMCPSKLEYFEKNIY
jgi:hypothetical protein